METIKQWDGVAWLWGPDSVSVGLVCGLGWTPAPVCDTLCRCSCRYVACGTIQALSHCLFAFVEMDYV